MQIQFPSGLVFTGRWNRNTYTINNLLGCGGRGDVYLGHSAAHGGPVALKFSLNLSSLYREHRVLSALTGSGVTPDVYEVDDMVYNGRILYFLSMEYIPGRSLRSIMQQGRVDSNKAAALGIMMADVLAQLHSEGYIYCDIKPENIILDKKRKRLVVIDFGGATSPGNPVKEFTPAYDRASWGLGSRTADEAYDIFALSVLLFEAVTGRSLHPFTDGGLPQLFEKQATLMPSLKNALVGGITGRSRNMTEFRRELARSVLKEPSRLFQIRLSPGLISQNTWLNIAGALSFAITLFLFLLAFFGH